MKTLYLIRGHSGSGKSTLAYQLVQGFVVRNIAVSEHAADDYFNTDGTYKFDAAKLPDAHKWCQDNCREDMELSIPVIIIHNTFSRQWELAPYRKLAADFGYTVFEIICNNNFKNVHGVPDDIVNKQKERMEYK